MKHNANEQIETIEQAMKFCFSDVQCGECKRKRFSNKGAAFFYSQSLQHLWEHGLGLVYGPFCNPEVHSDYWYEVSYE